MFAIARAIARRPLPAICAAGLIGYLAFGHSDEKKPTDPWSSTPAVAAPSGNNDGSMIAKAMGSAAEYAEKADSTGTVAKVRGTVTTTANSLGDSAESVGKATGN